MEASDSEDEIVDLNEAQTNSKTIIKKENNENEKLKENEDDNIADNNNNKNETKTSNASFIYTFIWEEGGTSVKLIGSFSDWKNQVPETAVHR